MPLVTTPGAANADSYATIAEADAYNAARNYTDDWTNADDSTKEASLREATRLIDAVFGWTGGAVDGVQVLTWPRKGMFTRNGFALPETLIPQELKNATSEFARQLLVADRTADSDIDVQGISAIRAGSVSLDFRAKSEGLSPEQALTMRGAALSYLSNMVPELVRRLLVPSWYVQPTLAQAGGVGLIFGAM